MKAIDRLNPYAHAMKLRRELYRRGVLRSWHPGIPVISIGNLSVGGTGKSPLTIEVAKYIQDRHKKRVAVVSRGYRRKSKGYLLVRDGSTVLAKVEESGDEAQMIAQVLPSAITIVDEDRVHGARQAALLGAEVILLDDGYQHLRLQRDLNILLIDAERELSNVLPLGHLREPMSAARDADLIVLTNVQRKESSGDLKVTLQRYSNAPIAEIHATAKELRSVDGESHSVNLLNGKLALAVSSIASPRRFHELLKRHGASIIPHELADHASYSEEEIDRIRRHAERSGVEVIVTTEKDFVKARRYYEHDPMPIPVYVLKLGLEFLSGEEGFYERIDQLL